MPVTLTLDQVFSAILSNGLPFVIAYFNKPTWSPRRRMATAVLIVWLFTILWQLLMWGLQGRYEHIAITTTGVAELLMMFMAHLAVTLISYQGIWKPSGWVQAFEVATSPPSIARDQLEIEAERKTEPPREPEGASSEAETLAARLALLTDAERRTAFIRRQQAEEREAREAWERAERDRSHPGDTP